MKKTINIEGMSCMHCVAAVKGALEELDNITSVEVSLEQSEAVVNGENLIDDLLKSCIEEEGYIVKSIN
ncbi:MAG: heavy-metal-associated domain-containing protein [Anaerorhabdus sp.]